VPVSNQGQVTMYKIWVRSHNIRDLNESSNGLLTSGKNCHYSDKNNQELSIASGMTRLTHGQTIDQLAYCSKY